MTPKQQIAVTVAVGVGSYFAGKSQGMVEGLKIGRVFGYREAIVDVLKATADNVMKG